MAAEPMTTIVAPRIEFSSTATGISTSYGVIVRVYDTLGNVAWECDINAATWSALVAAVVGAASTKYIPQNYTSYKGDGSLTSGGEINPTKWLGAA